MDGSDYVVNLNELSLDAVIECPYCGKGKHYLYGAKGKESSNCYNCHRLVLWDFDTLKAYRAKARKFAS